MNPPIEPMNWLRRIFQFRGKSAGGCAGGADPTSREQILLVLRQHLADKLHWPAENIASDARIFDSGYVDSLSVVDMLALIETRYGVPEIPVIELIGRLSTLDALSQHVFEQTRKNK